MIKLILYSKPGCHLCEGLQEKLAQIDNPELSLDIRDITTREDWFAAYEYEVPVLYYIPQPDQPPVMIPRPSPRASVQQLQQMLQRLI
jgi:hypothetical protein